MAVFSANRVVRTVTIHKENCRFISKDKLLTCGCRETGKNGNHRLYCEQHMSSTVIDQFMNGKFWAILMCETCFRSD